MPNQVASYLSRYLCFREPNWLDELSITLQVLGSTFGGSEFQADVKKKSPRLPTIWVASSVWERLF